MTAVPDARVDEYLDTLDDSTRADAVALIAMLRKVTGLEPTLWNVGTVGFGTYEYRYATGRAGQAHTIGVYPRRGKHTIYLMDGTARHAGLLARLGKHSVTGYCVYLKRLEDVDPDVLEQLLRASYENVAAKAAQGPITEILWKAEP